jgi:hypothetical protein
MATIPLFLLRWYPNPFACQQQWGSFGGDCPYLLRTLLSVGIKIQSAFLI